MADSAMDPVGVPEEEWLRSLIGDWQESTLDALHGQKTDKDFREWNDKLVPLLWKARLLMKKKLISEEEAQSAAMVRTIALLLPGSSLESIYKSLHTCLDAETTKGTLMELLLDENRNMSPLFEHDGEGLFSLQERLMAAQRPIPSTSRRNRRTLSAPRSYGWNVAMVYVLSQLAYDHLYFSGFCTVDELATKVTSLARSFGLHNVHRARSAHALFLLDLFVDPERPSPEGLTMDYVAQKLAEMNSMAIDVLADISDLPMNSVAALCAEKLLFQDDDAQDMKETVHLCFLIMRKFKYDRYLAELGNKTCDGRDAQVHEADSESDNGSLRMKLSRKGYPLLVHEQCLLTNLKEGSAVLVAAGMEKCPALSLAEKEMAYKLIFDYRLQTNTLFTDLDRRLPIMDKLPAMFAPYVGPIGMGCFENWYHLLSQHLAPTATEEERKYVWFASHQTLLQLMMGKYSFAKTMERFQLFWKLDTMAYDQQKRWAEKFLDEQHSIPPSLTANGAGINSLMRIEDDEVGQVEMLAEEAESPEVVEPREEVVELDDSDAVEEMVVDELSRKEMVTTGRENEPIELGGDSEEDQDDYSEQLDEERSSDGNKEYEAHVGFDIDREQGYRRESEEEVSGHEENVAVLDEQRHFAMDRGSDERTESESEEEEARASISGQKWLTPETGKQTRLDGEDTADEESVAKLFENDSRPSRHVEAALEPVLECPSGYDAEESQGLSEDDRHAGTLAGRSSPPQYDDGYLAEDSQDQGHTEDERHDDSVTKNAKTQRVDSTGYELEGHSEDDKPDEALTQPRPPEFDDGYDAECSQDDEQPKTQDEAGYDAEGHTEEEEGSEAAPTEDDEEEQIDRGETHAQSAVDIQRPPALALDPTLSDMSAADEREPTEQEDAGETSAEQPGTAGYVYKQHLPSAVRERTNAPTSLLDYAAKAQRQTDTEQELFDDRAMPSPAQVRPQPNAETSLPSDAAVGDIGSQTASVESRGTAMDIEETGELVVDHVPADLQTQAKAQPSEPDGAEKGLMDAAVTTNEYTSKQGIAASATEARQPDITLEFEMASPLLEEPITGLAVHDSTRSVAGTSEGSMSIESKPDNKQSIETGTDIVDHVPTEPTVRYGDSAAANSGASDRKPSATDDRKGSEAEEADENERQPEQSRDEHDRTASKTPETIRSSIGSQTGREVGVLDTPKPPSSLGRSPASTRTHTTSSHHLAPVPGDRTATSQTSGVKIYFDEESSVEENAAALEDLELKGSPEPNADRDQGPKGTYEKGDDDEEVDYENEEEEEKGEDDVGVSTPPTHRDSMSATRTATSSKGKTSANHEKSAGRRSTRLAASKEAETNKNDEPESERQQATSRATPQKRKTRATTRAGAPPEETTNRPESGRISKRGTRSDTAKEEEKEEGSDVDSDTEQPQRKKRRQTKAQATASAEKPDDTGDLESAKGDDIDDDDTATTATRKSSRLDKTKTAKTKTAKTKTAKTKTAKAKTAKTKTAKTTQKTRSTKTKNDETSDDSEEEVASRRTTRSRATRSTASRRSSSKRQDGEYSSDDEEEETKIPPTHRTPGRKTRSAKKQEETKSEDKQDTKRRVSKRKTRSKAAKEEEQEESSEDDSDTKQPAQKKRKTPRRSAVKKETTESQRRRTRASAKKSDVAKDESGEESSEDDSDTKQPAKKKQKTPRRSTAKKEAENTTESGRRRTRASAKKSYVAKDESSEDDGDSDDDDDKTKPTRKSSRLAKTTKVKKSASSNTRPPRPPTRRNPRRTAEDAETVDSTTSRTTRSSKRSRTTTKSQGTTATRRSTRNRK